jgi:hypothetical protein
MIRHHILAALASLSMVVGAAPALAAQDQAAAVDAGKAKLDKEGFVFLTEDEEEQLALEQEMTEAFSLLGALFKAEPLTPEQEALLPIATEMADHIMPEGSFRSAMVDSIEPMMAMMVGETTSDPRLRLAEISGVEADDLERLSDEDAQEAFDIFDPQFSARSERTTKALTGMMTRLLEEVEPAYREGLARALTRRFDESEMRALLAFFQTPLGTKFAAQSFLVQYDPQLMGVVEAMGPAAIKLIPELTEEFVAIEAELGGSRDFAHLSAAERSRAARLIGKSVRELDALVPEIMADDVGEEEDPVI